MENNPQGFKELQPGTPLAGDKYIIENKIGEGGFGITYKAVQTGLNRPVCIKEYFLAGSCVRNTQAKTVQLQGISEEKYEKFRQAFVKEAQTVATLHHPNVVEVIDIFDENNTSYMVMSFINGRTLQSIVDANGPLSYPDAVNYMAQISNAVDYIHKQNILHRDIKPDNIMVTPDYKAILIDFGSAREFEQDKTQMHTSMLTHGYAPPEQYTANSRKGSYTDIYALGATFYFILTGKVPLEAAARLTEPLIEPRLLNPSIPPEANQTVMKAMNLKQEDRYQQVQDFMDALQNVRHGTPEIKEDNVQQPKTKRRLLWAIVFAVLILGGAAASSIIVHQHRQYCATLVGTYNNYVEQFDNHLARINNPEDWEIPAHVMGALEALEEIENLEKNKKNMRCLNASGKNCYQEKLELFIKKVEDENSAMTEKMTSKDLGFEDDLSDADYQKLKERKSKNEDILTQLKQTGSASEVELKRAN